MSIKFSSIILLPVSLAIIGCFPLKVIAKNKLKVGTIEQMCKGNGVNEEIEIKIPPPKPGSQWSISFLTPKPNDLKIVTINQFAILKWTENKNNFKLIDKHPYQIKLESGEDSTILEIYLQTDIPKIFEGFALVLKVL